MYGQFLRFNALIIPASGASSKESGPVFRGNFLIQRPLARPCPASSPVGRYRHLNQSSGFVVLRGSIEPFVLSSNYSSGERLKSQVEVTNEKDFISMSCRRSVVFQDAVRLLFSCGVSLILSTQVSSPNEVHPPPPPSFI